MRRRSEEDLGGGLRRRTYGNIWELMGTYGNLWELMVTSWDFRLCFLCLRVCLRTCREPVFQMKRTPVTIYTYVFPTQIFTSMYMKISNNLQLFFNVHKVFQKFNYTIFTIFTNKAS